MTHRPGGMIYPVLLESIHILIGDHLNFLLNLNNALSSDRAMRTRSSWVKKNETQCKHQGFSFASILFLHYEFLKLSSFLLSLASTTPFYLGKIFYKVHCGNLIYDQCVCYRGNWNTEQFKIPLREN